MQTDSSAEALPPEVAAVALRLLAEQVDRYQVNPPVLEGVLGPRVLAGPGGV